MKKVVIQFTGCVNVLSRFAAVVILLSFWSLFLLIPRRYGACVSCKSKVSMEEKNSL